jgi:hypothetical protein
MLMVRRVLVEYAQVKSPGYQYRLDAFLALFFLGFPDPVIMEELLEKRVIAVHE